ncbi:MAG TPA: Ig-like domain-containing protein, partial [Gemmatimonadaceae bacterium]
MSVTLSPASIQAGQTSAASATGLDQSNAPMALGTVTWTSGTPAVASIAANGAITGVSPGQTQITALAGGKTGQATLTVTPAPASQLAIVAGNNQTATVAAHVATAPSVIAKDAFNNPVGGVAVTFAVATGGGSVTGGVQTT